MPSKSSSERFKIHLFSKSISKQAHSGSVGRKNSLSADDPHRANVSGLTRSSKGITFIRYRGNSPQSSRPTNHEHVLPRKVSWKARHASPTLAKSFSLPRDKSGAIVIIVIHQNVCVGVDRCGRREGRTYFPRRNVGRG